MGKKYATQAVYNVLVDVVVVVSVTDVVEVKVDDDVDDEVVVREVLLIVSVLVVPVVVVEHVSFPNVQELDLLLLQELEADEELSAPLAVPKKQPPCDDEHQPQ